MLGDLDPPLSLVHAFPLDFFVLFPPDPIAVLTLPTQRNGNVFGHFYFWMFHPG